MQTATVKWVGGEEFLAEMPSGHAVVFDADRKHNSAPGPMEMLLGALGACTAVDVAGILEEKAVRDAIELSQNKYCSVAATLRKTAEITYRFEISPAQK